MSIVAATQAIEQEETMAATSIHGLEGDKVAPRSSRSWSSYLHSMFSVAWMAVDATLKGASAWTTRSMRQNNQEEEDQVVEEEPATPADILLSFLDKLEMGHVATPQEVQHMRKLVNDAPDIHAPLRAPDIISPMDVDVTENLEHLLGTCATPTTTMRQLPPPGNSSNVMVPPFWNGLTHLPPSQQEMGPQELLDTQLEDSYRSTAAKLDVVLMSIMTDDVVEEPTAPAVSPGGHVTPPPSPSVEFDTATPKAEKSKSSRSLLDMIAKAGRSLHAKKRSWGEASQLSGELAIESNSGQNDKRAGGSFWKGGKRAPQRSHSELPRTAPPQTSIRHSTSGSVSDYYCPKCGYELEPRSTRTSERSRSSFRFSNAFKPFILKPSTSATRKQMSLKDAKLASKSESGADDTSSSIIAAWPVPEEPLDDVLPLPPASMSGAAGSSVPSLNSVVAAVAVAPPQPFRLVRFDMSTEQGEVLLGPRGPPGQLLAGNPAAALKCSSEKSRFAHVLGTAAAGSNGGMQLSPGIMEPAFVRQSQKVDSFNLMDLADADKIAAAGRPHRQQMAGSPAAIAALHAHGRILLGSQSYVSTDSNVSGASTKPSPPIYLEVERMLASAETSVTFDMFLFHEVTNGHPLSTLGFYLVHKAGLVTAFNLDAWKLSRWLRKIEGGYVAGNPYHNAVHAADVLQTLHIILHISGLVPAHVDALTLLACYIAAIIHDYQHLGVNNDYLVNTNNHLALLYNDRSPMENHHLTAAFTELLNPELNFMVGFPKAINPKTNKEEPLYPKLRKLIVDLVLATDMKQHNSLLSQFQSVKRRRTRQTGDGTLRTASNLSSQLTSTTAGAEGMASKMSHTSTFSQHTTGHPDSPGPQTAPVSPALSMQPNANTGTAGALLLSRNSMNSQSHRLASRNSRASTRSSASACLSALPSPSASNQRLAKLSTLNARQSAHAVALEQPEGVQEVDVAAVAVAQQVPVQRKVVFSVMNGCERTMSGPLMTGSSAMMGLDLQVGLDAYEPRSPSANGGTTQNQSPSPAIIRRLPQVAVSQSPMSSFSAFGDAVSPSRTSLFRNSSLRKSGQLMRRSTPGRTSQGSSMSALNTLLTTTNTTIDSQHDAVVPMDDAERLLTLQIAFKCADLGHIAEGRDVHLRWVAALEEEFFRQGDMERAAGLPISPLFDRTKPGVTKSQVGFFDMVVLPLFTGLAKSFPGAKPLHRAVVDNYNFWLAEQKRTVT